MVKIKSMIRKMSNADIIAELAMKLTATAKRAGVNIAWIMQDGGNWNFDSTGSPTWTDAAADVFTSFSMDMIDEEMERIDSLLSPIVNDAEELLN